MFFKSKRKGPTLIIFDLPSGFAIVIFGVSTRSDESALTESDELLFSSCSDSLIDYTQEAAEDRIELPENLNWGGFLAFNTVVDLNIEW